MSDPMADALAAALPAGAGAPIWAVRHIAEHTAARLREQGWRLVQAPAEPLLDQVRDHVGEECVAELSEGSG